MKLFKKNKKFVEPLSDEDLSRFWYCPKDKSILQIDHNRAAQTAYFSIWRGNLDVSIKNAVSVKKIPPEAKKQTKELVKYIFDHAPSDKQNVELVSVKCPKCKRAYSAPRVKTVKSVEGINTARELYQEDKQRETKQYGRFRFRDKVGIGRSSRDDDGPQIPYILFWVFNFFYIIMVIVFFYIMGFEVRIGKRWIPVGMIFMGLVTLWIIYAVLFTNLSNDIVRFIRAIF